MFNDERNARIDHYETLELDRLLALEMDRPKDVDLLVCIGRCYFNLRDLASCCDYYAMALKLDPYDGWSHLYWASFLSALGCNDDALTHLRYAADFMPDVACPHWCLGDYYRGIGDFGKADYHFNRAVEVDPDDRMARVKLREWEADNARK